MKAKNFIVLIIILFVSIAWTGDRSINVTYVSNEGFLLESDNKKILIDALFGGLKAEWCDVPDKELVSSMENAAMPFNNVDLILVTHYHWDHFNVSIAEKHLLNNPHGVLICTPQIHTLFKRRKNYSKFSTQIQEVLPQFGESISKNIEGINVKIMRLAHSQYMITDEKTGKKVDKHKNVQNLGFLITINGHKILHTGDAGFSNEEEYQPYKLVDENIDMAFVQASPSNSIITDIISPKNIVMMHISPEEKNDITNNLIKNNFTHVTIFQNPLDSKHYTYKEEK